jgi:hypothetical protein
VQPRHGQGRVDAAPASPPTALLNAAGQLGVAGVVLVDAVAEGQRERARHAPAQALHRAQRVADLEPGWHHRAEPGAPQRALAHQARVRVARPALRRQQPHARVHAPRARPVAHLEVTQAVQHHARELRHVHGGEAELLFFAPVAPIHDELPPAAPHEGAGGERPPLAGQRFRVVAAAAADDVRGAPDPPSHDVLRARRRRRRQEEEEADEEEGPRDDAHFVDGVKTVFFFLNPTIQLQGRVRRSLSLHLGARVCRTCMWARRKRAF